MKTFWKITPKQKATIEKMGHKTFVNAGEFFIADATAEVIGMTSSIKVVQAESMVTSFDTQKKNDDEFWGWCNNCGKEDIFTDPVTWGKFTTEHFCM